MADTRRLGRRTFGCAGSTPAFGTSRPGRAPEPTGVRRGLAVAVGAEEAEIARAAVAPVPADVIHVERDRETLPRAVVATPLTPVLPPGGDEGSRERAASDTSGACGQLHQVVLRRTSRRPPQPLRPPLTGEVRGVEVPLCDQRLQPCVGTPARRAAEYPLDLRHRSARRYRPSELQPRTGHRRHLLDAR